MIKSALVCEQDHFDFMSVGDFNDHYKDTPVEHDRYDNVSVVFVTLDDGVGDYCTLEERTLHLVLHVEPNNEAMVEAFERNFFEGEMA